MKIKYFIIMLLVILVGFSYNILAEEDIVYDSNLDKILAKGKMIVGLYYKDMPPFFMTDSQGNLSGLDIELARGIASQLGVELEYNREAKTYQSLYENLLNKEVDLIISKFSMTYERLKKIRYSVPYLTLRWGVMVNSSFALENNINADTIFRLQEIPMRLGVKGKTSFAEFARDYFTGAEIKDYTDWKKVLEALKNREIDVAFYDENEIKMSLYNNPHLALVAKVYFSDEHRDNIAIAMQRESEHLQAWINFYLKKNNYDLSVDDLMARYPEVYEK